MNALPGTDVINLKKVGQLVGATTTRQAKPSGKCLPVQLQVHGAMKEVVGFGSDRLVVKVPRDRLLGPVECELVRS